MDGGGWAEVVSIRRSYQNYYASINLVPIASNYVDYVFINRSVSEFHCSNIERPHLSSRDCVYPVNFYIAVPDGILQRHTS